MNVNELPKIELHCHLDGSVRPASIIDIAKREGIELPTYEIESIKKLVTAPLDCPSLDEYLKRFTLPISVMQSSESLERVAFELLEDAAMENTKYIEVRFAPILHINKGLNIKGVIESVLKGIRNAESMYDIKGNLILSCLRNMPIETAYEMIEEGKNFIGDGVVAVDIAGSEKEGFVENYIDCIRLAKNYGFRVTIHAGETGIGKNVFDAVTLLGAERIGHGIYIKDYEEAYKIVKEKGVTLEICPTSNVQTKAVSSYRNHPIYDFFIDGIKVTINTDNRTVSGIDLTKEYSILRDELKFKLEDYKDIYINSVYASFAEETTKNKLLKHINFQ